MTNPTSTPKYEPGDVVVVFVPYPKQPKAGQKAPPGSIELTGLYGKRRPMVVASASKHNTTEDLHVALLTSQVGKARHRGEYVLKRWKEVGLQRESAIRPRLHHIIKQDVIRRLGRLHSDDRQGLDGMVKDLFGLD